MKTQPIRLSKRHIKAMDRVGGANLILDWPADLPPGKPLERDWEREATAAEKIAAEAIVKPACEAAGLVPVHVRVVNVPRPMGYPRAGEYEQHLAVLIIGRRWVHATGQRNREPPDLWPTRTEGSTMSKVKTPADMLADIGRALYGEHWRRPLADALGINERQIRRWLAGDTLADDHPVFADALTMLRRRQREIVGIADRLSRWREPAGTR